MKISFLCGSLESGRDGVGDYVRRFAAHLERMDHRVQLVALADQFVEGSSEATDDRPSGGLFRLGREAWRRGALQEVERRVRGFEPDVLSLQMVCYAYAQRGVMAGCAARFARLGTLAPLRHLMLHELWIGEATEETLRARLLGRMQRHFLLQSVDAWSPHRVHTNSSVYVELLRRAGIGCSRLPLPGNIPRRPTSAAQARAALLQRLGLAAEADSGLYLAGVFGSIHPEWEDHRSLEQLGTALHRQGRRLVLLQIGHAGPVGDAIWDRVALRLEPHIPCTRLGGMSPEQISTLLAGLDLGIATSPWRLIEKSGTVAAFVEHDIPVLVTRDDYRLRRGPTPQPYGHPLVMLAHGRDLQDLLLPGTRHHTSGPGDDPYAQFITALARPSAQHRASDLPG
ncbi:MAG TPA: hypothetical protein VMI92_11300 [Steroidobacteraceae bacterium]|nr:hypothetical protein [Steroidobacteraceae bacterium]